MSNSTFLSKQKYFFSKLLDFLVSDYVSLYHESKEEFYKEIMTLSLVSLAMCILLMLNIYIIEN
jgi:hypothetical protein